MKNNIAVQDNVNVPDTAAGAIGLGGSLIAAMLDIINIETIIDATSVAAVTLLVSFYGNRLLRWIHKDKKKKDMEA